MARRRHTDLSRLSRELTGDLDWVTRKAIEKDRRRRYPSASELAADITRHFEDEPVTACPPDFVYRVRKFIRKNRGPVAAFLAILVVLTAGIVTSTAFYLKSEKARKEAIREVERNRLEAAALEAALMDDFNAYLERSNAALEMHRSILGPDNPELAPYLVKQLVVLGLISLFKELPPEMETLFEAREKEALEKLRRAVATGAPGMLESLILLAGYFEEKNGSLSRELYRQALTLDEETPQGHPQLSERVEKLAGLNWEQGIESLDKGDPVAAEPLLREALDLRRKASPTRTDEIARLERDLGICLVALGEYQEAEPLLLGSYRFFYSALGVKSPSTQRAIKGLIALYQATNNPSAAQYRGLLPELLVNSVRELGELQFEGDIQSPVGFSVLLGNESIWLFSDLIGDTPLGTSDLDARDGITVFQEPLTASGGPGEFFPFTADEIAFNQAHKGEDCIEDCGTRLALGPLGAVWDEKRNRALVFYKKERVRPGEGLAGFKTVGTSVAVWKSPHKRPIRPLVRPESSDPTILFPRPAPVFGSGALVVGEDLYAYACHSKNFKSLCRVGRVPLERALERGAWRFYAGSNIWSSDWRDAHIVMDAAPPLTVHWNDYLHKYLAIYVNTFQGTVSIRVSDRPEGPWSQNEQILEVLPAGNKSRFFSGIGHPEFSREGGRVEYLTYYRPMGVFEGQTRLVEVVFR